MLECFASLSPNRTGRRMLASVPLCLIPLVSHNFGWTSTTCWPQKNTKIRTAECNPCGEGDKFQSVNRFMSPAKSRPTRGEKLTVSRTHGDKSKVFSDTRQVSFPTDIFQTVKYHEKVLKVQFHDNLPPARRLIRLLWLWARCQLEVAGVSAALLDRTSSAATVCDWWGRFIWPSYLWLRKPFPFLPWSRTP